MSVRAGSRPALGLVGILGVLLLASFPQPAAAKSARSSAFALTGTHQRAHGAPAARCVDHPPIRDRMANGHIRVSPTIVGLTTFPTLAVLRRSLSSNASAFAISHSVEAASLDELEAAVALHESRSQPTRACLL